jgi:predicted ribosomally synthesized peptide with nif11-like leader
MKTLDDFIQRLEDDAAFEQQAQALVTEDDLMAFVHGEGYDFTLKQLTEKFQPGGKPASEAEAASPASIKDAAPNPQRADEAAVPAGPAIFAPGGQNPALPKSKSQDSTLAHPPPEVQKTLVAALTPGPEEKMPEEISRAGGGRHRGISLHRMKCLTREEPSAGDGQ